MPVVQLLAPGETKAQSQTTHGNQSPAVNGVQGDVRININPASEKTYRLKDRQGGQLSVFRTPNRSGWPINMSNVICTPFAGTTVKVLPETAPEQGFAQFWRKISISNGECAGQVGWVESNTIVYE